METKKKRKDIYLLFTRPDWGTIEMTQLFLISYRNLSFFTEMFKKCKIYETHPNFIVDLFCSIFYIITPWMNIIAITFMDKTHLCKPPIQINMHIGLIIHCA